MGYTAGSIKSNFPSQAVSDLEKISYDYGLKIAKAIESEWFNDNVGSVGTKYQGSNNRYSGNQTEFHRLRLYARGEQSIQKYKDELSINGDLSYLNLDWKPVPIIPKLVDIVVNGMSDKEYEVKAYSQDMFGVSTRTEYMDSILSDMNISLGLDRFWNLFLPYTIQPKFDQLIEVKPAARMQLLLPFELKIH